MKKPIAKKQVAPKPVPPPKPDETAQIVLNGPAMNSHILRFKDEKKAASVWRQLFSAWGAAKAGKGSYIFIVPGDMFSSVIDLSTFSSAALVIHRLRNKFMPIA